MRAVGNTSKIRSRDRIENWENEELGNKREIGEKDKTTNNVGKMITDELDCVNGWQHYDKYYRLQSLFL